MPTFRDLVYALVAAVPAGRVTSYGRVAAALGYSGKAREVGWALHAIPDGLAINPHRVIRWDGRLSGGSAFGSPEVQRALLEADGVRFLPDGRVDLRRHLWGATEAARAAEAVLESEPSQAHPIRQVSGDRFH